MDRGGTLRANLIHRPQSQAPKSASPRHRHSLVQVSQQKLLGPCEKAKQPRTSSIVRQSSSAEFASGSGDGGGKDIPPRWTVSEEDPFFDNGPTHENDAILAKNNVDPKSLPVDVQDALQRGAVSPRDLELLLKTAAIPVVGTLCRLLPFIRDRVIGNPRFLLVLAIEEVIGVSAKMAAEIQGRKDEFWNELHFVASDIALEVIGDFAVVCLLSPKASFRERPKSGIGRAISGLPGHAFQIGKFSLTQRLATILYRGAQFFSVGFASSALGHGLTKWSVEREQLANPRKEGEEPYKPLAPVLDNSLTWGGFMGLSTNLRYQLVNGIEERALDSLVGSPPLRAAITFILRFGNTFAGGAQWVWYARCIGLQ